MLSPDQGRAGVTIASVPKTTGLTYADLAAIPDDGLRRELLDGELFVSPSPLTRHQRLVSYLHLRLGGSVETHGGCEVFLAPLDVLFSESNVLEPDLFFVPDEQRDIVTRANIQGVPALVIEVLSDHRMDRVRKREIYARFGVPEYWIVDPTADRVEIYRLGNDGYGKPEMLEAGDTLLYAGFPGLEIDITSLFDR